jgi:plasmanylethanolamine desaturase
LEAEAANKPSGYSRLHRSFEIGSIVVFLALLTLLSVRIGVSVKGIVDVLWVGVCVVGGLLLADFISGLVHWAGDTLLTEKAPFIGPHFIKPFREHHVDPKAITRHDFIETNGNNCLVSVPVLGVMTPTMPEETGFSFYLCTVLVFAIWFIFGTNQFHKWAHADNPPRIARFLQRWGVILVPAHHDVHHAAPHDKYYCITVGWLNPILGQLRFFRALEWIIARTYPAALHIEERSRAVAAQASVPALARRPSVF